MPTKSADRIQQVGMLRVHDGDHAYRSLADFKTSVTLRYHFLHICRSMFGHRKALRRGNMNYAIHQHRGVGM